MSVQAAGQAAPVTYEKAATQVLGRRAVALIIDSFIVGAILSAVTFGPGWIEINDNDGLVYNDAGLYALAHILIPIVYWWFFEAIFSATPGKFVTGIRVYEKDGENPGVIRTFIRNIVRPLWFYWLVGWVVALATGDRRQRTFDLIAGCVVARKR